MFSYIHSTSVIVSDQEAALNFYVNTLGWEKAMDMTMPNMGGMRWLTVVPPGAKTQLALAHTSWFTEGEAKPGSTGLSLITPDIDATYAELTAKGVKFKSPVEVMPWGDKGTWFYDPDGNEFFLVEETKA